MIVGKIINEVMNKNGYSKKILSQKINIDVNFLEKIINAEEEINEEISNSINLLVNNKNINLFQIQQNNKRAKKILEDKKIDEIYSSLNNTLFNDWKNNYKYFEYSKKKLISSLFNDEINNYEKYVKNNVNFYSVNTKNEYNKYFWIAIAENLFDSNDYFKINKKNKKVNFKSLINDILEITINNNKLNELKIKKILNKNNIGITNLPYLNNSGIKSAVLNRGELNIIMMSDAQKRKCCYVFHLIHEIIHIWKKELNHSEINKETRNIIENYMNENNIYEDDIIKMFEIFDNKNEIFERIRNETKIKLNFDKKRLYKIFDKKLKYQF